MIRCRKFNRRIHFIKIIKGKDEDGYPKDNEKLLKTVWASVRSLRGKEFFNAAKINSENLKVFNLKYFKGLETNMFIKYNEKLYNIKSINDLNENHKEYEIYASEVSSSE